MKISISPTEEMCSLEELCMDPEKCFLRVWQGTTEGGVAVEAYVLTIVPDKEGFEKFKTELPDFMFSSSAMQNIEEH